MGRRIRRQGRSLPVVVFGALVLTALVASLGAPPVQAVDPPIETLVPLQASGYRYQVVSQGSGAGFEQPSFDDSAFADGTAAFGSPGCVAPEAITTPWAPVTDLLLRRTVALPNDGRELHVALSAIGAVSVWVNGTEVTSGLTPVAGSCPGRFDLELVVPDALLVRGGDNLLAVRGRSPAHEAYLDLTAVLAARPANDGFDSARVAASLPMTDSVSLLAATAQAGEDTSGCPFELPCGTVWYALTPAESGSFVVDAFMGPAGDMPSPQSIHVYTGDSLEALTLVAGRPASDQPLVFRGTAGTTYFIQVVGARRLGYYGGETTVTLAPAGTPAVGVSLSPESGITTATSVSLWVSVEDPARQQVATIALDFGDGTTGEGWSTTHYFKQTGTLEVKATVTMADGRIASGTHSVDVAAFDGPDPAASFTTSPANPDTVTTITFQSTSTDPALVGIERWAWAFDDGGTADLPTVEHRFVTAGDHVVNLTVTTYDGRTATASATIGVTQATLPDPQPSFWFWPSAPYAGQQVSFSDGSWDPGGQGIQTLVWSFGDGATGSGCCVSHTFASPGTYTVALTVTTYDGRHATASQDVVVSPPPDPVASFWWYPDAPSALDDVQFVNGSWDPAGGGFATQSWSFGDGTTSSDASPAHHFPADGDYTVKLDVSTPDGRTASISQVVRVATDDVSVSKLVAPKSSSVGQTKPVTFELRSLGYGETVNVQLLRSTSGGYDVVGERQVRVEPGHPARVTFDYRFTSQDAQLGRVTFKVVATLDGARDARPADNEAIAAPTRVSQ